MTREEAINIILNDVNTYTIREGIALNMAIKALEQEPKTEVLDKIRAEITNIPITAIDGHNNNWYREPQAIINDALQIIDKYKAESEV